MQTLHTMSQNIDRLSIPHDVKARVEYLRSRAATYEGIGRPLTAEAYRTAAARLLRPFIQG